MRYLKLLAVRNKWIHVFVFIFLAVTPTAVSEQSVIEIMNKAMRSIVNIDAEIGGLFRTPGTAIRDSKTGRIVIAHGIKAIKHARHGAGAIIDASGIIVTNAHTVSKAKRVTVTLYDNAKFEAAIVEIIPNEDIALIKISCPYMLVPMAFADSDSIGLRTRVFTVGSSKVLKGTLSEGQVTGIGKKAHNQHTDTDYIDLIQTSFSVYKGDSGGPLLDPEGKLLGIIVAGRSQTSHVSFAIPSNKILPYYKDYLSKRNLE